MLILDLYLYKMLHTVECLRIHEELTIRLGFSLLFLAASSACYISIRAGTNLATFLNYTVLWYIIFIVIFVHLSL